MNQIKIGRIYKPKKDRLTIATKAFLMPLKVTQHEVLVDILHTNNKVFLDRYHFQEIYELVEWQE